MLTIRSRATRGEWSTPPVRPSRRGLDVVEFAADGRLERILLFHYN